MSRPDESTVHERWPPSSPGWKRLPMLTFGACPLISGLLWYDDLAARCRKTGGSREHMKAGLQLKSHLDQVRAWHEVYSMLPSRARAARLVTLYLCCGAGAGLVWRGCSRMRQSAHLHSWV